MADDGRVEIRLAGSGGQGIVLAGVILAEAAILSGKNTAQSQAYGPQSRGGASRADVVISDGEIGFPQAQSLDVLVALTAEAYERYAPDVRPDGLLVVDADAATGPPGAPRLRALPIVATAIREGSAVAANIVALGALVGLTGVVETDALERAVSTRFSARSRETNLRGLAAGLQLAEEGG